MFLIIKTLFLQPQVLYFSFYVYVGCYVVQSIWLTQCNESEDNQSSFYIRDEPV